MTEVISGGRAALTDTWVLTRRAFAHWLRDPGPVLFSLLFNVLIVLMFAYLFGGAMRVPDGGDYREFLMPGMFVMTMLFGIGLTASAIGTDARRGVTDRFRSMPTSPAAILAGRAVADLAFSVVTLAVMALTGLAVGWRPDGSPLAAFALILLLRFALIWVGIFVGLTLTGPETITGVQTMEFPIGFLSAAFVAPATMPGWLGAIAEWNPLSSTVGAARKLFGDPGAGGDSWIAGHPVPMAVAWPVVLVLIFFPLSVRAYRRLSR